MVMPRTQSSGHSSFTGLKYLDAFRKLSPSDFNRFKNAIERGDLPVTHFNRIVTEHSSPALPGPDTPTPAGRRRKKPQSNRGEGE